MSLANSLQPGDEAPDFTLPDEFGTMVTLSKLRGKRVVVYFYPKDDTPGCTLQACGFRDSYPEIQERNAVVLGISSDNARSHRDFKTKYDLPFTLLVDSDHAVADAYGAWDEARGFPRRSHFVVDEQGRLVDVQLGVPAGSSVQLALETLRQSR
jgi:thioredoxin-dependent peroxiredoxin